MKLDATTRRALAAQAGRPAAHAAPPIRSTPSRAAAACRKMTAGLVLAATLASSSPALAASGREGPTRAARPAATAPASLLDQAREKASNITPERTGHREWTPPARVAPPGRAEYWKARDQYNRDRLDAASIEGSNSRIRHARKDLVHAVLGAVGGAVGARALGSAIGHSMPLAKTKALPKLAIGGALIAGAIAAGDAIRRGALRKTERVDWPAAPSPPQSARTAGAEDPAPAFAPPGQVRVGGGTQSHAVRPDGGRTGQQAERNRGPSR